jgi:hypothetical protein
MTSHLEKMEADLNICDDGGDRLREEGYKCSKIRNLLREIDIKCSKIESTLEPSEQLYERLEIIERIKNQESIFPHAALRRVITPDLVRELLPGHGAAVDNMANAICSSFCAILGILAKMERTQDIEKFVKAGVDDSYLPIIPPTGTEVPVSNGKSIEIQDWKRRRWDIFDKFQSCFLSPFFARPGGTIYHFRLTNSRQKPPILEQDETESWEDESDGPLSESLSGSSFGILADIVSHNAGAHGSVKKVRLDALSHNFGDFPVC